MEQEELDEILDTESLEQPEEIDTTPTVPTSFDNFVTWVHRIFARDVDPNNQTHILLRFLMIVGAVWYLGRGLYGILLG